MKLSTEKSTNYSRGIQTTAEYGIRANSKMFDMLSNMLYSDKIKAPIRELSTNAWDAHVEAGTTDQVPRINLPTKDNTIFSIRDYGTGLSEERIHNLYRFYGASSKDDSNLYNGALGIGSKSPFAYTDSFTVTSFYNGKQYVYINNKHSKNGRPEIKRLTCLDTDEPNGLQISFSVKKEDIDKFINTTQNVLKYFPKEFEVIDESGKYRPIKKDNEIILEGKNWKILKRNNNTYYYRGSPVAVMGYIGYNINIEQIYPKWNNENREVLKQNIHIYFDIGEIEMDISREDLQYNTKTIKAIQNKVVEIKKDISKELSKRLDSCKNLYAARIVLSSISNSIRNLADGITYKNYKDITYNIRVPTPVKCAVGLKQGGMSYQCHYIECNGNRDIYINDTSGPYVNTLLSEVKSRNKDGYVLKFTDSQEEKDFKARIGLDEDDVTYISKLKPVVTKKYNTVKRKYKRKVRKYIHAYKYGPLQSFWKEDTVDFSKGGYYIEFNNYKIVINKSRAHPSIICNIDNVIPELKDKTIYGFGKLDLKKIDKKIWTNVIDLIYKEKTEFNKIYGLYNSLRKIPTDHRLEEIYDYISDIDDPELTKSIKFMIDAIGCEKYYKTIIEIERVINLNIKPVKYSFDKEINSSFKKYPLLKRFVSTYLSNPSKDEIKHLIFYINNVHKKGV